MKGGCKQTCTNFSSIRIFDSKIRFFFRIFRLQSARLYPIAIFLKPSDSGFIMSINDRMTEEQADKAFNRAARLEHDFINYFTSIIKGDSFDEVYDKVKTVIKTHSKNTIWVPANEMF